MRFPISDPILFAIGAIADEAKMEAYVIGGYVRDELLERARMIGHPRMTGHPRKDIDLVVIGDGVGFASLLANEFEGARLAVYEQFRTAALQIGDHVIEIVGARKESYRKGSRNPITEAG